ncbi:MAG: hypothetical protein HYV51_02995 [Parcubacteria group bacterium]|nr:hypothetical protein [Parcubacteria group bacterium]
MATQKTMAGVMQNFFGYHPSNPAASGMKLEDVRKLPYEQGVAVGGIKGFAVELARLSGDEKIELARGAAKELGLGQEAVDFPLS